MTLGIFTEVLQRWFGDIASVEAGGEIRTPVRQGVTIEIPETLTVLATFAAGFPATLEFSNIHSDAPAEELFIKGSEGTLHIDFAAETVAKTTNGHARMLTPPAGLDRPWQVERDFIHAVQAPQAPRPEPTFRSGVAYMRVVEAVDSALTSGSRVEIELPN